jgi:hypothetical protein
MAHDEPASHSAPHRRTWHDIDSRPGAAASSKRGKALVFLFIMLVTGALLGWLIYLWTRPPRPYFLSIPITQYTRGFYPPNAFAKSDDDLLCSLFSDWRSAFGNQEDRRRLENELVHLPMKQKTLIVYLSGHAVIENGKVFILPANARPDDTERRLPFDKVIENMESCPVGEKLLILDMMKPLADLRLGILADEVAEKVQHVLYSRRLPFFVLCACSEGECSQVSPELNGSVFAYYIAEGLRGWAHGYASGEDKPNVSVRDLAKFVEVRVSRWAAENRSCRQTPTFSAPDEKRNFDLAIPKGPLGHNRDDEPALPADTASAPAVTDAKTVDPKTVTAQKGTDPKSSPPSGYPEKLRKSWLKYDTVLADGSYRFRPRTFRLIQEKLLQDDERWRAGIAITTVDKELLDDFDQPFEQLRRKLVDEVQPTDRSEPDPAFVEKLMVLVKFADEVSGIERAMKGVPPERQDPTLKRKQDDLNKLLAKFKEGLTDKSVNLVRLTILKVGAADDTPAAGGLDVMLDVLHSKSGRYDLIQRLGDVLKLNDPDPWTKAVRQAFRAELESENVGPIDQQIRRWLGRRWNDAEIKRQEGEALLSKQDPATSGRVAVLLEEAAKEYQEVRSEAQLLREAYLRYAEALVRLPGYAPIIDGILRHDPQTKEQWRTALQTAEQRRETLATAVSDAKELASLLDKPVEDGNLPTARLASITGSLKRNLDLLYQTRGNIQDLTKKAQAEVATAYWEMEALLNSTALKPEEREAVWRAQRLLAARLDRRVWQLDRKDDELKSGTTSQPPSGAPVGTVIENDRADMRTKLAVEILRLDGLDSEAAEIERRRVGRSWPALGERVRKAFELRELAGRRE